MRNSLASLLKRLWRRVLGKPDVPPDPYAHELVPVDRGPHHRGGAIALDPPDEFLETDAQSKKK